MAGQLFVRDVEVPEATRKLRAPDPAFVDLPFEDAIRVFRERAIVDPETFYSDLEGIRQRSFTASNLTSEYLTRRAYALLRAALERGLTVEQFVADMRANVDQLGIESVTDGYLRTVFETNVAANYGAGRFQQITHPVVAEARPFVEYRAVRDNATRPAHRALHGTVYRTASPAWHQIAPPNGFNCRCTMITRPAEWARGRKVLLVPTEQPDPSFEGPPSTALEV